MIRLFSTVVVITVLCLQQPVSGAGYGSVEGQIILDDAVPSVPPLVKKGDPKVKWDRVCCQQEIPDESRQFDPETKGIANVFVYLRRPPTEIHPDLKSSSVPEVDFTVENCRFHPHALIVRTDQKVVYTSKDIVSHNIHMNPFASPPDGLIILPSDPGPHKFSFPKPETLPMKVQCDIHHWMLSWWLVLDHPYAAITDKQGKFKIENLPEGEHEFRVWHENTGYIARKLSVTIKAGETTTVETIKVPLTAFESR